MNFFKKSKLLLLLVSASLIFSSCGKQADLSLEADAETYNTGAEMRIENLKAEPKKESQTKIAEADMETIEPPEDGWTLEDLLSVTYIYGQKISYPCTLNDLGEDFEFDFENFHKNSETNMITLPLKYEKNTIACVIMNESDKEKIDKDTEILRLSFFESLKSEIKVNGIALNSTKDQVILNFGEPDEIVKETFYYGTGKKVLALNFGDDIVIGIHIILQDYSL